MRSYGRGLRVLGALACLLAALALSGCKKDLDKVPKDRDAALTPQQLLEKGTSLSRRGHYYRARQILEKVLSRPNAGAELIAKANLAIADAYYYDGGVINVAEALSRYTSFLTFYPTHPSADYVQYQIGLCHLKQVLAPDRDQTTTRQALDAFVKVANDYTDSGYAKAAREKADECRERLGESEFRVGLFYMKRRGHFGAIERFRTILESYPRYSKRDQVYFQLATALRARGKVDEALLYLQKVVEEYPKSRWAAEAREILDETAVPPGRTAETTADKPSSARRDAAAAPPGGGGAPRP